MSATPALIASIPARVWTTAATDASDATFISPDNAISINVIVTVLALFYNGY